MKQIISIAATVLILFGLLLTPVSAAGPCVPLRDAELPPDFFDEDCDGGPSCPGRIFADMPPAGHWAHVAIDWALTHHVTTGTSDDAFSPDLGCTRAQAVTFMWRANGSPEPASDKCPFEDVPESAYYAKAVLWAYEQEITTGTSDTAFSPDVVCTRAQIVTFLWRAGGCPAPAGFAVNLTFLDVEAGAYYENAVAWAVENGVTDGTSDTTFSPDAACTRAHIVTFLYRAVRK